MHVGDIPGMRVSDAVLRDRDDRIAADTRSAIDIWHGVPAPGRSALDQRKPPEPPRSR